MVQLLFMIKKKKISTSVLVYYCGLEVLIDLSYFVSEC